MNIEDFERLQVTIAKERLFYLRWSIRVRKIGAWFKGVSLTIAEPTFKLYKWLVWRPNKIGSWICGIADWLYAQAPRDPFR